MRLTIFYGWQNNFQIEIKLNHELLTTSLQFKHFMYAIIYSDMINMKNINYTYITKNFQAKIIWVIEVPIEWWCLFYFISILHNLFVFGLLVQGFLLF